MAAPRAIPSKPPLSLIFATPLCGLASSPPHPSHTLPHCHLPSLCLLLFRPSRSSEDRGLGPRPTAFLDAPFPPPSCQNVHCTKRSPFLHWAPTHYRSWRALEPSPPPFSHFTKLHCHQRQHYYYHHHNVSFNPCPPPRSQLRTKSPPIPPAPPFVCLLRDSLLHLQLLSCGLAAHPVLARPHCLSELFRLASLPPPPPAFSSKGGPLFCRLWVVCALSLPPLWPKSLLSVRSVSTKKSHLAFFCGFAAR